MFYKFLFILVLSLIYEFAQSKKNVLLMLADDGGFEMRAYNNKICQTPFLDALAKKSLIFSNAYSADSSCSPSRSAILTGRPNHENGMYGLHQGVHHFNSFEKLQTLPKILKNNGIFTGIIGKKHVGPKSVYSFNYEETEENNSILQVGRNITKIKLLVREFLNVTKSQPFFLYVAFHDPHRCGHTHPEFGAFCEKFGNGEEGNGHIPDWAPIYYQANQIKLPYFVPDTLATRLDVSAQYTTISRLDQGVGLVLKELENAGVSNETLIIYTSDNGIPFPSGRTNLYDPGIAQPMFIHSPTAIRKNQVTYQMASHLDIAPTILDWFNVSERSAETLTGTSLLPLLEKGKITSVVIFYTRDDMNNKKIVLPGKKKVAEWQPEALKHQLERKYILEEIKFLSKIFFLSEPDNYNRSIFASHSHHEITMYYPSRAIRTKRYKLIHNINYQAPFPIDQDLYVSPTFQDILNKTKNKTPFIWNTNLRKYYYRQEWELYDLKHDPEELNNIAKKNSSKEIFFKLQEELMEWLNKTKDPWLCSPHSVLENSGFYKAQPQCMALLN